MSEGKPVTPTWLTPGELDRAERHIHDVVQNADVNAALVQMSRDAIRLRALAPHVVDCASEDTIMRCSTCDEMRTLLAAIEARQPK